MGGRTPGHHQQQGSPPTPPAAPLKVEAMRLNQSPRSRTTRRVPDAAEKARFNAARVILSMRLRTKAGRRSISPSALLPTISMISIPRPPASR